ncbi:MAG TPA: hypothetical protein PKB06_00125, partial [Actinotalea sp.]|nr:hypothetical protein [Actinotalea sp.]
MTQHHPSTTLTSRASVHREPVVAVDDRVLGYTVTVTLESEGPVGLDPITTAAVLHDQYLSLDLGALVADRDAFVPATPAMLDGFVPESPAGGRVVLDLPPGYELREDAVRRATALRALGVGLDLRRFAATPLQMRLLPHLGFVTVEPAELEQSLDEVVRAARAGGVRVLAAGV